MCISNIDAPCSRASKWLVASNVALVAFAFLAVINYFGGFLIAPVGDPADPDIARWALPALPFEAARNDWTKNPRYGWFGVPAEPGAEIGRLVCLVTVVAASAAASVMFARLFSRIRSQEVSGKPPQLPTRSQLLVPALLTAYSNLLVLVLSFWGLACVFLTVVTSAGFVWDDIVSVLLAAVLTTAGLFSSILSLRMSVYAMRGVFANVYRDPAVTDNIEVPRTAYRIVMVAGGLMCLTAVLVLIDAAVQAVIGSMAAAFIPLLLQIPAVWCSALLRWRWRRRMVYAAYALLSLYPMCLTAWHWVLASNWQVYCSKSRGGWLYDCTDDGKLERVYKDEDRKAEFEMECMKMHREFLECQQSGDEPSWVLLIIIFIVGSVAWVMALVGLRMVALSDIEHCELNGSLPTSNESLEQLRTMRDIVAMRGARSLGDLPRTGGAGRVVEARSGGSRSRKVTPDKRGRKVSSRSSTSSAGSHRMRRS